MKNITRLKVKNFFRRMVGLKMHVPSGDAGCIACCTERAPFKCKLCGFKQPREVMTADDMAATVTENLFNAVENGIPVSELRSMSAYDLIEDMKQCGGLPDNLASYAPGYNAALEWKRNIK